jgi:hypothetical protein
MSDASATRAAGTPPPPPGPTPTLKNAVIYDGAAGSKYQGMLIPNRAVIPGVPGPNPVSMIVQPDYSKGVRDVTESDKKQVAVRDGVNPADLPQYEVDHLIPLVWGGANDQGNLWCQPIAQARIKDVVELHGLLYLRANPTPQALLGLQKAENWIRAAVDIVDPGLSKMNPAARIDLETQVAGDLAKSKSYKLAALAYRELERAHTPRAQRPPAQNRVMMDEIDVSDRWDAPQRATEFGKLAAKCEKLAEASDDKD